MAKAMLIIEDRQDGDGVSVTVDFVTTFDSSSDAHAFIRAASEGIMQYAKEQGGEVKRHTCPLSILQ